MIDETVQRKQALRKKRHAMALATYAVPLVVTLLCWNRGILPIQVVAHFTVLVVLINISMLVLIQTNLNLKLPDPTLTYVHLGLSAIPMLWVMYFLENGNARAVYMMFIVVALLYGIFELDRRRFLQLCLWIIGLYAIMLVLLARQRPQDLDISMETIRAISFLMAMVTTSILGGYISSLRAKLRKRNNELREAIERIEELVNIDPLTSVCNRRRLFDVLSEEVSRYSRGHMSFSLFILDIDQFKRINDAHGHLAGDEILYRIASHISDNTRIIDSFGRYGGEEFLMVLPQTSLEGAVIKAERVRRQVESLDFSDIVKDLKVTVSVGVAEYRLGEDVDETLLRADQALYAAKANGRNRVETEQTAAAANPAE